MLKFSECTIRGNWFTWQDKFCRGGVHAKQITSWSIVTYGVGPGNVGIDLSGYLIEGTREEIESIIDWIVERT